MAAIPSHWASLKRFPFSSNHSIIAPLRLPTHNSLSSSTPPLLNWTTSLALPKQRVCHCSSSFSTGWLTELWQHEGKERSYTAMLPLTPAPLHFKLSSVFRRPYSLRHASTHRHRHTLTQLHALLAPCSLPRGRKLKSHHLYVSALLLQSSPHFHNIPIPLLPHSWCIRQAVLEIRVGYASLTLTVTPSECRSVYPSICLSEQIPLLVGWGCKERQRYMIRYRVMVGEMKCNTICWHGWLAQTIYSNDL